MDRENCGGGELRALRDPPPAVAFRPRLELPTTRHPVVVAVFEVANPAIEVPQRDVAQRTP